VAIGDPYATLPELKGRLGLADSDTADDARLTLALQAASRGIDATCRRQFNDSGAASPRRFPAASAHLIEVDDFTGTAIVATDTAGTGVFDLAWTSADFQAEPLHGIVGGIDGWPFWMLRALGAARFPHWRHCPGRHADDGRAVVQVTARWGWAAVPAPIKEATLIVASETFKLKDAPFGVAGYGEYGAVRIRENPVASAMIAPYRRSVVTIA
jgi:hypothetical protein